MLPSVLGGRPVLVITPYVRGSGRPSESSAGPEKGFSMRSCGGPDALRSRGSAGFMSRLSINSARLRAERSAHRGAARADLGERLLPGRRAARCCCTTGRRSSRCRAGSVTRGSRPRWTSTSSRWTTGSAARTPGTRSCPAGATAGQHNNRRQPQTASRPRPRKPCRRAKSGSSRKRPQTPDRTCKPQVEGSIPSRRTSRRTTERWA